ncbi:mitotic checkpoint regulator, MAD2B-interacting-domain-containing protein [Aspergillus multicolor]|uniref:PRCC domain-containing protein n=1 Tax=Aspergillus multicolor TaxID=41759 RepID=UPI003CCD3216
MALVAYSDSEASDSEPETPVPAAPTPVAKPTPISNAPPAPASKTTTIVDKTNPRKIRVALPEVKPEAPGDEGEDGPARKKPKIGGDGAFAGFNSFLPAPKRPNATVEKEKKLAGGGPARKVFSLKTGAAPGFDRKADEEMRNDMAFDSLGGSDDEDETIPKAGSLRDSEDVESTTVMKKKPEEVVLKGNPMVFKPLSVLRTGQKKRRGPIIPPPLPEPKPKAAATMEEKEAVVKSETRAQKPTAPPPAPKPKVSLFSLSAATEETATPDLSTSAHGSTYEPLVYTTSENAPAAGPAPETESIPAASTQPPASAQTLDYIADDLNLSRSQRRQLFGRNADASTSKILHFNTDAEYAANQEMAHKELAATQHNPVRAIAPGKHTLQQLVNAASTQKEALEESFASGKRNKKEAGAKYGW